MKELIKNCRTQPILIEPNLTIVKTNQNIVELNQTNSNHIELIERNHTLTRVQSSINQRLID